MRSRQSRTICNVNRCKECHPNQEKLTPEQLQKIREKINQPNFTPKLKKCNQNCKYCNDYLWKFNERLYWKIATDSTLKNNNTSPNKEEIKKELIPQEKEIVDFETPQKMDIINDTQSEIQALEKNVQLKSISSFTEKQVKGNGLELNVLF